MGCVASKGSIKGKTKAINRLPADLRRSPRKLVRHDAAEVLHYASNTAPVPFSSPKKICPC